MMAALRQFAQPSTFLGSQAFTALLDITIALGSLVFAAGGCWSLENSLTSMLWQMPQLQPVLQHDRISVADLDICAFAGPYMKPTRFIAIGFSVAGLRCRCPGLSATHTHEPLTGQVLHENRVVYRTKLAQVYPH